MTEVWAVTGATGLVGRFIVEDLLARRRPVIHLGRRPASPRFFSAHVAFRSFDLDRAGETDLCGVTHLVHAAFDHVPGRYRGGEGSDPEGFRRRNGDGSAALFARATACGVGRILFLSSRAVYGAYPDGTCLREDMAPRPDTLYGAVKAQAEDALTALAGPGLSTCILRATGVYGPAGPGQRHKWSGLFAAHRAGETTAPRAGTELHGADLACGLWRAAQQPGASVWNLSDLIVDRHDLLAALDRLDGVARPLPTRADPGRLSVMECDRLRALGWRPRGRDGLIAALPELAAQASVPGANPP